MPKVMLAKLTSKGQMTIPQEIRTRLKLGAGDYVMLRPVAGGVFVSKASVQPDADVNAAVRELASAVLGAATEETGPAARPSVDGGDEREEATREPPPNHVQRRIAELTLAYLGRERGPKDSVTDLDSERIAQAIVEHYGTDDIIEIIDALRGRGGT